MKLTYRYGIRSISGKLLGLILSEWKETKTAYCRQLTKPKETEQHVKFGSSKKNIGAVWRSCSAAFKEDLREYSRRRIAAYGRDRIPAYGYYAYFIKFLYKYAAEHPGIDLKSATKEELEAEGCPMNVRDMVDGRYLPEVQDAGDLVNGW